MTGVLAHELMTLGVASPRIGIDWKRQPSRYLTIDGIPAYQIAYSCGTCSLVLRRQPGAPGGTASVTEVRDRLNGGLDGFDRQLIDAFSSQLPRSDYLVMLLEVKPRLVVPGSADDYFATDGPAGWRNEEFEYSVDPTTTQYADVASHPTAVTFGLLDIEGPWFRRERHWGLFHFLLDGHHKTAAAARAGRPLRLLTFVSASDSFAGDDELLRLPEVLEAGNTAQSE